VDVRLWPVPRLNGAVTAQRAVPTNFGIRVEWLNRRGDFSGSTVQRFNDLTNFSSSGAGGVKTP
jgi:hypothetical protein